MSKKLRIGILGAGGISQLVHIPILKKHKYADLVAIADLEYDKAVKVAEKFKIPSFYRDPDEIFSRDDIDAVHINTPTNSHLALALAALSAGKHVLVEKPIARRADEALRMVEAAKNANRKLMVAMNLRFRPDSMILHDFVEGRELGKVRIVRAGWLKRKSNWSRNPWLANARISGGGVMMDLGLPLLDVCLWIMGNPKVQRVSASMMKDRLGLPVEDTVCAFYSLSGGSTIMLNTTWSYMSDENAAFTVFSGDKGMAELDPLKITKEIRGNLVNVTPAGKNLRTQNLYKRSYEYEVDHFLKLLMRETKALSPGKDAAALMRIVEATYKAASENREVEIGES
ncbi:Gfo/Idh/MocA family oxidoreductase [bacterium]|nr:Gfo/Idh/MocA family oxidoreductase [bacterium]